jgi:rod shape-determining protein MreD
MSNLLKNIIRFVLLILLQVFVLNKVMLYGYATPYLYVLFILVLPFDTPRGALMVYGLLLGLCLDMFMNTPGMHAAACVVTAYLRPFVIGKLAQREDLEAVKKTPSVSTMGWSPFLTYALILVVVHHIVYFSLEFFDLHNVLLLCAKILLSGLASLILIVLYEMLFAPLRKTR